MRAVQRFPFRKVYFRRTDDTHYIHSILPGIERVTWNTEKRAIASGVTRPLQVVLVPDVWSQLARRDIPVPASTETGAGDGRDYISICSKASILSEASSLPFQGGDILA